MGMKGSRTEKNLLAAFAGESQARNRYTFYAGIASKEGYEGIAAIFLETADNERMHAKRYFDLLAGRDVETTAAYPAKIGNTAVNLEAAATIFFRVADVEVEHEKRYQKLLARVKEGTLFKRKKPIRWKCIKCGRIHEGTEAPERCPTCVHPQAWFIPAEENY